MEALFSKEASPRSRAVLAAAAHLFAERGYAATSMRDIGERVGLQGGSLYHHIRSKEELFARIHDTAIQAAEGRIRAAIALHEDPWAQLEAAAVTMLEIQLDPRSITLPLMNDLRAVPASLAARLIATRDAFETLFKDLVAALPLKPGFDRPLYRLLLLTLLNHVGDWYRPGRSTPAEIAAEIVRLFRHEATGDASP
ncbi:TetR family transcriptional regulator [Xaviernesmea oryzae]|uniref:TetR family transcriptional regulator n=2 Tax=Xaviernesmea oryzae TaxID=464029 RepID=A0A1Q9AU66_9HYPH|nr:TetR family transcriptional regulator [Xaviernesmea oryzae]